MPAATSPMETDALAKAGTGNETCGGARWLWEVVGGESAGGIQVQTGEALDSPTLAARLSTGALVEEIRFRGGRLLFRRLSGLGPEEGWIFTELNGKCLAVRADRAPLKPRQPPPAAVGPNGEEPLPVALVFTGQLVPRDTYEALVAIDLPAVKEKLDRAMQIAGFDDQAQEVQQVAPWPTWLTSFLAGIAGLEKLKIQFPEVARRAAVMTGLGAGQYTALVAAGVFSFEDALKLLKVRHELQVEAMAICEQGMTMITGLDLETLWPLCRQSRKREGLDAVCQIAAYMDRKHFWVSGTETALRLVESWAAKSGARVRRMLPVASNTRIFGCLQARLEVALEEALPNMRPPLHTVWMPSSAEPVRPGCNPADIVAELKHELTNPMLHYQCRAAMQKEGIREIHRVIWTPRPLEPIPFDQFRKRTMCHSTPSDERNP